MGRKAKTSQQLRKECLKSIQLLARISAADDQGYAKCVSCGIVQHYKQMDGGHFIPKGNSSYWALEVENVHPQCKGCNAFEMKHGTAQIAYTHFMHDMYGKDFVDEMLATKSNPKKLYKTDYVGLLDHLNGLVKYHQERIG